MGGMRRNIRLAIQYEGTDYCGWQRQKNAGSVQETIEKALSSILRHDVKLIGSGRTDSGVHASFQVANFITTRDIPLRKLKLALNSLLPDDICISGIAKTSISFNARKDCKSKAYEYLIYNTRRKLTPFMRRYCIRVFHDLDVSQMRKAASKLKGTHDFASFMGSRSGAKSSVRTIKKISVVKKGRYIKIRVEANGFLYNMVRAIAGTLIEIGRHRLKADDIGRILKARDRKEAGPNAEAKGLKLVNVKY